LIGFWYTDDEKAKAGQKAFIVNRIGDFAFIIGLFLIYWEAQTFDYVELGRLAADGVSAAKIFSIAPAATILIFIGCTGKSAQIPLYTWLPDAMAGPTPVSALIHAATMVTSGVYLLGRLHYLVSMSPVAMMVIASVGAATAFVAASIALVQNDIKKVLAYSTVSQLGYMFIGIGSGAFVGAIFHLMTHAFFKALLFLGSGSVIHANGGEQDIRKMGGLRKWMPITHGTFFIACLAISGVPMLAGFFSKDLILWGALSNVHVFRIEGIQTGIDLLTTTVAAPIAGGSKLTVDGVWTTVYSIVFALGIVTAGMTAFYMFRLYILTFLGDFRGTDEVKAHLHESPMTMTIPLVVLALLSIVGGYTGWPHVVAHAAHIRLTSTGLPITTAHTPKTSKSARSWCPFS
jgi:NADH-quinone oxidoreductase subunit L